MMNEFTGIDLRHRETTGELRAETNFPDRFYC